MTSDIGRRISDLLQAKNGGNQSELARFVGVTPQAVQQWIAGETSPRGNNLRKVAEFLGATLEYLLTGGITVTRNIGASADANVEPGPDLHGQVPLISSVQAGEWASIVDNFQPGDAEDWLFYPKKLGPRAFALRVSGVSMEPRYQHGDIIFVDPDVPAEHGRNVVVRLDDENQATFKQLVVEGDHRFLKPLNPDWPGPKLIQIDGNATICGVVIGKWVPE
jgi:SOS-response transcriptional repressor LexA